MAHSHQLFRCVILAAHILPLLATPSCFVSAKIKQTINDSAYSQESRIPLSVRSKTHLAEGSSPNRCPDPDGHVSRKKALDQIFRNMFFVGVAGASIPLANSFPETASAACLSGDTSSSCIGVYKMPIDDRVRAYVETPEVLARFAPDIKWVPPVTPPNSYADAVKELEMLKSDCEGVLISSISRGQLEEAGKELLRINPRAIVAGKVVVETLADNTLVSREKELKKAKVDLSMKALRAEAAYTALVNEMGGCDILIGQGLRGDLGVTTAAQILILETLKEVNGHFDEFFRAIPDAYKNKLVA